MKVRWLGAILGLMAMALGVFMIRGRAGPTRPFLAVLPAPVAASHPRIRVQVLNTTRTRGLARRATRLLRDHGYDVVETGTTTPMRDTTLVLARSGHSDWAMAVAALMRPSRAEARPDSSRYLDLTVLVGSSWRPPSVPLDP